jgi:hypothetical protein
MGQGDGGVITHSRTKPTHECEESFTRIVRKFTRSRESFLHHDRIHRRQDVVSILEVPVHGGVMEPSGSA